jgi:hypothetical protein
VLELHAFGGDAAVDGTVEPDVTALLAIVAPALLFGVVAVAAALHEAEAPGGALRCAFGPGGDAPALLAAVALDLEAGFEQNAGMALVVVGGEG